MHIRVMSCLLLIVFSCKTQNKLAIHVYKVEGTMIYVDGNNNRYNISDANGEYSIKYEPVAKENSSSGEYSGGEVSSTVISKVDYEEVLALLQKAVDDKSNRIENRNMGCGTIIWSNNNYSAAMIAMHSPVKAAIEGRLNRLIKENKIYTISGFVREDDFIDKGGRNYGTKDYFFYPDVESKKANKLNESYFIKFKAAKVSKETILKHIGKKVAVTARIIFGKWDSDDSKEQSRIGEYIIILDLNNE